MNHEPRRCLLALAALALAGCERAPRDPGTRGPSAPATIAGEIVLSGELASVRRGAVTLYAWRTGEAGREGAQPYLSRTYAIGDPDWSSGGGTLMRYFGLCDADRVGDPERILPGEFEIEACFDPDGLSATREGIVRGRARARNGAKDVTITVSPTTETALPPGTRKKGG
jgi:hypothetical protein